MHTYLSSHVYIIRYINNTYVVFQMLLVNLQHCCWASYQIAEQVTIVNLVALRGSWGIVFDNDLESNRRSDPGEGTHFMNITYAPPFWPPFSGLWKVCLVSTPILEQKRGKCHILTPIFKNLAKCIVSISFFNPRPLRPKGYCRHLRLSVCPSVRPSVCPSVRLSVCLFPSSLLTQ